MSEQIEREGENMKQRIKQWELETGIEVREPKGVKGRKNNIYNRYYSRGEFRKYARRSIITIKTQKGLEFMRGGELCNTIES